MSPTPLILPADFDDYEWEVTAKGFFGPAELVAAGSRYHLNFYDHARLRQEVEGQLDRGTHFLEPNLVVIASVTRAAMERAAHDLATSGQYVALVPLNCP